MDAWCADVHSYLRTESKYLSHCRHSDFHRQWVFSIWFVAADGLAENLLHLRFCNIKAFRVLTETYVRILNDMRDSDSSPSVLPNTESIEVLEPYILLEWVQVR